MTESQGKFFELLFDQIHSVTSPFEMRIYVHFATRQLFQHKLLAFRQVEAPNYTPHFILFSDEFAIELSDISLTCPPFGGTK